VKTHFFKFGSFALGSLCTALIGVPTGIYVTERANTHMVVQQQTLNTLQSFETTGGQLDNAVRQVSDALAKGASVDKGRDALRDAVSAHSSAAFVLRDELGTDYAPYMAKMREMRGYADRATNAREGVAMWQSAADLIAMRKRAADRVKAEATK
jgi:hypothetical protein